MRILFIADVVGEDGRRAVSTRAPSYHEQGVDAVIANGENAAGGLGITPRIAKEILAAGVDVITSGNHIFRRSEIVPFMDDPHILRPGNFRARAPGRAHGIFESRSGVPFAVLNLSGQLYMDPADDPAAMADEILSGPLEGIAIRILDFHAEATGEKQGMFRYLDGRVTAVIGTHTHVQTADETVSSLGTAFITDAGMTGSLAGVIGMDPSPLLTGIRTGLPQRYAPARGSAELQGVLIDVDESTGRASSIARVRDAVPDEEKPKQP